MEKIFVVKESPFFITLMFKYVMILLSRQTEYRIYMKTTKNEETLAH